MKLSTDLMVTHVLIYFQLFSHVSYELYETCIRAFLLAFLRNDKMETVFKAD